MKKATKFIVSFMMILCSVIILSACKPKIESAEVKQGTLETIIVKGEELDTSKTVVIFTYTDKSTIEVEADKLVFAEFNSNLIGTHNLKITYEDFSFEVQIKVVATEADVNAITSLSSKLLTEFKANSGLQGATEEDKQTEFVNLNEPLYVGDDNAFDFRISATGLDSIGNIVTNLTRVRTIIKVELKNGESFVELTGNDLENTVEIDDINTTLDFKESAIGKTYRVTVSAENVDEDYIEEEAQTTSFSTELTVVDGYNVYSARDLALYDNTHESYNNIKPTDQSVKALILQSDINITKDDVRKDAFWTEDNPNYPTNPSAITDQTIVGTPIDSTTTGLYHRTMTSGETFDFIGNYFSVSIQDFPKMVVEWEDAQNGVNIENNEMMTAHLCVFFNTVDPSNNANGSSVNWKNLYFIGNGELNAQAENSGSLVLCKANAVNFNVDNTLSHNFYISYFFNRSREFNANEGVNTINNCKSYNAYQTFIYAWGTKSLTVMNSEFKSAGGPVIITDHSCMDDDDYNTGFVSNVDFIGCTLESLVTGKEPWFITYGADKLFGQIVMADALFTGYDASGNPNGLPQTGKTLTAETVKDNGVDVSKVNLVAVMKSGDNQGLSTQRIKGYTRIFDTIENYEKFYATENAEKTTYGLDMTDGTLTSKAMTGSVYFESSATGGYINSNVGTNGDMTQGYYEGDYTNVYIFNGMGAIFRLYPVTQN